jgi:hypothetical protein
MKGTHWSKEVQHRQHLEWLSKLDFYREQIAIFQNELQQVVREHPQLLSIIEHVDEYRSILIRKKIHLEQLRQKIQEEQQALLSGGQEAKGQDAHLMLSADLQDFFDEMESLKPTFRRFVAYND